MRREADRRCAPIARRERDPRGYHGRSLAAHFRVRRGADRRSARVGIPQARSAERIGKLGVDVPVSSVVKQVLEMIMKIPQARIFERPERRKLTCLRHTS